MTVLITRSGVGYSAYIGNIGVNSIEIGKIIIRSGWDIGVGRIVWTG